MQKTWFDQVKIGEIIAQNRIVMSPLTRCRCEKKHGIANDAMIKHYTDRADMGLIITECSAVEQRGNCFPHSPGIYTDEMTAGWKKIVDAVHQKGGKIVLQIWHGGRAVTSQQSDGLQPIGPSSLSARGKQRYFHYNYEIPHELTIEEIQQIIKMFRKGAENAKKAGFDGIEVHGAHGYLVDSFIRDCSNKRTDAYGGSIEKRCRFPLEIIDQMIEVFGAGKVGIRLSPVNRENDMCDSNPVATYTHLIKELDKKGVAFLDLREAEPIKGGYDFGYGYGGDQIANVCKTFRAFFKGIIMANQSFDGVTGLQKIQSGDADMIAFGLPSISNPDLVKRIKNGYPFNMNINMQGLFSQDFVGYNDYPTYEEQLKSQQ